MQGVSPAPQTRLKCHMFVATISGHPASCNRIDPGWRDTCLLHLMIHHGRFSVAACKALDQSAQCREIAALMMGDLSYCGPAYGPDACSRSGVASLRGFEVMFSLENLQHIVGKTYVPPEVPAE